MGPLLLLLQNAVSFLAFAYRSGSDTQAENGCKGVQRRCLQLVAGVILCRPFRAFSGEILPIFRRVFTVTGRQFEYLDRHA